MGRSTTSRSTCSSAGSRSAPAGGRRAWWSGIRRRRPWRRNRRPPPRCAPGRGRSPSPAPVLLVTPSLRTFDGRSRVIPLLHEIPDPLTAVSYGTYALIAESRGKPAKGLADGGRDPAGLGGGPMDRCRPPPPRPARGGHRCQPWTSRRTYPPAVRSRHRRLIACLRCQEAGGDWTGASACRSCPDPCDAQKRGMLPRHPGGGPRPPQATPCIPPHEHKTLPLGHGDRPGQLHRLRRLRGRLLRREQHPPDRPGRAPPGARDVLDPDRAVLRRAGGSAWSSCR